MLSTAMDGYQIVGWITGGVLLVALAMALAMSAHYRYLAQRRDRDIDRLFTILRTAGSSTVTYDTMHQAPTRV